MTGGTGFIGRRAVPRLLARGYEVHGLGRRPGPASRGIQWHQADLRDHDKVREVVAQVRPSHLLHLAWETAHASYYTTSENLRWLEDSLVLVDAFIASGGRRIVGAGSAAEYDLTATTDLSESTTPIRPNGLYPACKSALWHVIAAYSAQAGVGHAWGRVFFCYGPGEDPDRFVPSLIRRLVAGESVPFQEGTTIRDYVYVDDVAEGFAALVDTPSDGAFNLGSGAPVRLSDLVERIAREAGRPGAVTFGALPTPSYEPARVVADVTRVHAELGWRPRTSLEDGIRQTVAWWRSRC